MRHNLSDLVKRVTAQRRGKGRDAHYIAECPICGYSHPVDVLADDASAEVLAKQKIIEHLQARHGDDLDV